jgi:hypothetical protein
MRIKKVLGFLSCFLAVTIAFSNLSITGNVIVPAIGNGISSILALVFFLVGFGLLFGSVLDGHEDPLYRKKEDLESRLKIESLNSEREGVSLPSGTFYGGPAYTAKLHSEIGYHAHLLYDNKDTNYFITISNGYFIAVPHGEGVRKSEKAHLDLKSNSARKRIKVDIRDELRKLKKRDNYRPVPTSESEKEGLIYLFKTDEI